jgi:hypothetical protein
VILRPDGIVYVEIAAGVDQSVDHARENLRACRELAHDKRRPLLVNLRGAMVLTPETRLVYSDSAIADSFCALAMIIDKEPISRMMINLYLQVAKMAMPMRVFSEVDPAARWLSRYSVL